MLDTVGVPNTEEQHTDEPHQDSEDISDETKQAKPAVTSEVGLMERWTE